MECSCKIRPRGTGAAAETLHDIVLERIRRWPPTNRPATTRAKGPGASGSQLRTKATDEATWTKRDKTRANLAIGRRRRQGRSSRLCAARGRPADGLGGGKAILEAGAKMLT